MYWSPVGVELTAVAMLSPLQMASTINALSEKISGSRFDAADIVDAAPEAGWGEGRYLSTPATDRGHSVRPGTRIRHVGLSGLAGSILLMSPVLTCRALCEDQPRMTYSDIAPARPGRIAEQEEFDSAQGSVEKLELFLKRHPDGALAEMARQALDRLKADREQKPR